MSSLEEIRDRFYSDLVGVSVAQDASPNVFHGRVKNEVLIPGDMLEPYTIEDARRAFQMFRSQFTAVVEFQDRVTRLARSLGPNLQNIKRKG